MSNVVEISAGEPLRGKLRVPGDKSISHRALLFGALAEGESTIRGLSHGRDVAGTAAALRALGIRIETSNEVTRISGGLENIRPTSAVLDLGNSGTTARLMIGWLARFDWSTTISGDASLRKRPMDRVIGPLREMGASFDGDNLLPITVHGGNLHAIEYTPPVRSAQIKTAILIAGLAANGTTVVHEPILTRAHTEEMLAEFGADISTIENIDGSCTISVSPSEINPFDIDIATDPSAAAFWMVAASIVPESDITLENVYVGPGRGGLIDVLARMGADIDLRHTSGTTADVRVRYSQLRSTDVGEDEIPSLIDELPVLSVAAAVAKGITVVTDAEELRVKESDRLAAIDTQLAPLGMSIKTSQDGFVVRGDPGKSLHGGRVEAHLDHRIAMTAAVAALISKDPVTISGWDSVATSYPTFLSDLEYLRSNA